MGEADSGQACSLLKGAGRIADDDTAENRASAKALHHLTARGDARSAHFRDGVAPKILLSVLAVCRQQRKESPEKGVVKTKACPPALSVRLSGYRKNSV